MKKIILIVLLFLAGLAVLFFWLWAPARKATTERPAPMMESSPIDRSEPPVIAAPAFPPPTPSPGGVPDPKEIQRSPGRVPDPTEINRNN